jgi:hypothetical protein
MFVDHQFLVDGFGRLLTSENTGPNGDDDDSQSIQTDKGLNTQQYDEVPESESGAKRRVGGATAGIKLGLSSRAHPPPNKTSPSSVLSLSSPSSNTSAWTRTVGDGGLQRHRIRWSGGTGLDIPLVPSVRRKDV